jgi:hypothetical protein
MPRVTKNQKSTKPVSTKSPKDGQTGRRISDEELLNLFLAARPPAILEDKDFQHFEPED